VLETVFLREIGIFVSDDVLFQRKGTLSGRLNRARGARGDKGDPNGANPGVGGHEHQRVPRIGESLRRGGWGFAWGLGRSGPGRRCECDYGNALPGGGSAHGDEKNALRSRSLRRREGV